MLYFNGQKCAFQHFSDPRGMKKKHGIIYRTNWRWNNRETNALAIQPSGNEHVFKTIGIQRKLWNNFRKRWKKCMRKIASVAIPYCGRSAANQIFECNSYTKLSILTHAHNKFTNILLIWGCVNHGQRKRKHFVVSCVAAMLTAMELSHCIFRFVERMRSPERLLPCESAYMRGILFSNTQINERYIQKYVLIIALAFEKFLAQRLHHHFSRSTIQMDSIEPFFIAAQRDIYMKSN